VLCGLLATVGVAAADGPTLSVKPTSVKSSGGEATFTVSGKGWQQSAFGCGKGGTFFVALQLQRGNVTAVKLPRAGLKTGGSSFTKKITAKVKPGQYNVRGTLACQFKGRHGGANSSTVATTPLTVR
jgi:hypothetical protein